MALWQMSSAAEKIYTAIESPDSIAEQTKNNAKGLENKMINEQRDYLVYLLTKNIDAYRSLVQTFSQRSGDNTKGLIQFNEGRWRRRGGQYDVALLQAAMIDCGSKLNEVQRGQGTVAKEKLGLATLKIPVDGKLGVGTLEGLVTLAKELSIQNAFENGKPTRNLIKAIFEMCNNQTSASDQTNDNQSMISKSETQQVEVKEQLTITSDLDDIFGDAVSVSNLSFTPDGKLTIKNGIDIASGITFDANGKANVRIDGKNIDKDNPIAKVTVEIRKNGTSYDIVTKEGEPYVQSQPGVISPNISMIYQFNPGYRGGVITFYEQVVTPQSKEKLVAMLPGIAKVNEYNKNNPKYKISQVLVDEKGNVTGVNIGNITQDNETIDIGPLITITTLTEIRYGLQDLRDKNKRYTPPTFIVSGGSVSSSIQGKSTN